jgi:hypothetical protein
MRFNPHAFKRTQDAPGQTAVRPDATAPSSQAEVQPPAHADEPSRTLAGFIQQYGRPNADKVVVPEHSLAVTLAMKFNDSAPQVDYWNHHAHLGCPDFLLLIVRKQNGRPNFSRTEHLARQALALCPELQRLDWKWHKDNYRGGQGCYLGSSSFPLPPVLRDAVTARTTWGAQPVAAVFWEIEFTSGKPGDRLQLFPHRHFGERPPNVAESTAAGPITVAWRQNHRLNGVEIHFSRRPDDAALAPIRNARHNGDRWRYNGHDHCWWIKQSPEAIAFAAQFCEQFARDALTCTATNGQQPPTNPVTIVSPPVMPPIQRPPRKIIRFCPIEVLTCG